MWDGTSYVGELGYDLLRLIVILEAMAGTPFRDAFLNWFLFLHRTTPKLALGTQKQRLDRTSHLRPMIVLGPSGTGAGCAISLTWGAGRPVVLSIK